ncbi:protein translocase subunit SecD [Gleimia hominis]|uniref:protein translocase subunit SecD n=1 Tax=Gleimia hominis TaxID=595468 RepID=UPI000C7F8799|nr:protein translocase subunit SecD [Gleimia hominis]WIK65114.1 protein translocase subunit SecD [Gleimia hominis]
MAKKKKSPVRTLVALAIVIVIAAGALIGGHVAGKTSLFPELALDLQGGTQLILTPTAREGEDPAKVKISQEDLQEAINVIRQRVDASGVAEAEITSQGGRNILVALPGHPSEDTLNLVRSSAVMRFRPLLAAGQPQKLDPNAIEKAKAQAEEEKKAKEEGRKPNPDVKAPKSDLTTEEAAKQQADRNGDGKISAEPEQKPKDNSDTAWISEKAVYDFLTTDCTDPKQLAKGSADDPKKPLVTCDHEGKEKYILGPVDLEGTMLKAANAGMATNEQGQNTGQWMVSLEFNKQGAKAFSDVSKRLVDLKQTDPVRNQFAVVLDGNVISAPSMNSQITNGSAQITGSFTAKEAKTLANQLQFGSLPLNFQVESEQHISATLGASHLEKGLWAGLIGLILVVLYLVWQYHGLAVVAAGSLVVAALMSYLSITLLSWLMGYRLSLAGVAGLMISIGITADSFIVYFERIRDEVREGKVLGSAVSDGWRLARRTIIVSDLVNLLAAVILYLLAVGGVQGFAFTLGLTTIVDLAIILFFTHPMMEMLIRTRFFGEGHRWSGLDPEHLGAHSRAIYQGRGRIAAPRKAKKKAAAGAVAVEPGRVSIAQRRRMEEEREEAVNATMDAPADGEEGDAQ